MREYEIHLAAQGGDTQEPAQGKKNACGNYPERRSDSNIPEHFADGMPLISQNNADRRATLPHPRHYKTEQEPFKEKSEQIKANAVRIRRRAQMICKNPSIERPAAQHGEHENRVDWASGLGVTV